MEENYLRDAPPNHERDGVEPGVIGDLHGPTVRKSYVAPSGAFANLDEVASHRRSGLHLGRDAVQSSDKFLRVAEDGLSWGYEDYQVVV